MFDPTKKGTARLVQYANGAPGNASQVVYALSIGLRDKSFLDGSPERVKDLFVSQNLATDATAQLEQLGVSNDEEGVFGCSLNGVGQFYNGNANPVEANILIPKYTVTNDRKLRVDEIWVSDKDWDFTDAPSNRLLEIATRTATAYVSAGGLAIDPFALPRFMALMNFPVNVTLSDGSVLPNQYVRFGVDDTTKSITHLVYGGSEVDVTKAFRSLQDRPGDYNVRLPAVPPSSGVQVQGIQVYALAQSMGQQKLTIKHYQPYGLDTDIVLELALS